MHNRMSPYRKALAKVFFKYFAVDINHNAFNVLHKLALYLYAAEWKLELG